MKPWKTLLAAATFSLFPLLWSCDKTTAGGSDEIDTRVAVDPSGKPVASARVVLVRSGDSTQTAQAVTTTGNDGAFPELRVPDGWYSLVVHSPSDSLGKFVDSLHVVSNRLPGGRDTLRAVGRIRGMVRLLGGDPPSTVVVGLVGTDILANAKADGTFSVELVPGGTYTLGAVSSVDGYGPLYLRLRLREGQDTLLADALDLPYSGLPAPSGFSVTEDSSTGNVRLSWEKVAHPDLGGYVVERLEGGLITSTRNLNDTFWTDSMKAHWDSLPFLGPWPVRDVVYRVRTRSLSIASDSRSMVRSFRVDPPAWTTRIDSVRIGIAMDSSKGIGRLSWNTPSHPDVALWRVTRSLDGVVDCSFEARAGAWSDSACGDARILIRDTGSNGPNNSIREQRDPIVVYQVSAIGKSTSRIELLSSTAVHYPSLRPLVEWESISNVDDSTMVRSFGGWLMQSSRYGGYPARSRVSRDGSNWEEIPDWDRDDPGHPRSPRLVTGLGDSLWICWPLPDRHHVAIASRVAPGVWDTSIFLSSGRLWGAGFSWDMGKPVVIDGRVAFLAKISADTGGEIWNGQALYRFGPSGTIDTVPGGSALLKDGRLANDAIETLEDGNWIDIDPTYGLSSRVGRGTTILHSMTSVRFSSREWTFSAGSAVGLQGGCVVLLSGKEAYFTPSGNGWILPEPGGRYLEDAGRFAVFHDEIWAVVGGHLWKGKLNLSAL